MLFQVFFPWLWSQQCTYLLSGMREGTLLLTVSLLPLPSLSLSLSLSRYLLSLTTLLDIFVRSECLTCARCYATADPTCIMTCTTSRTTKPCMDFEAPYP